MKIIKRQFLAVVSILVFVIFSTFVFVACGDEEKDIVGVGFHNLTVNYDGDAHAVLVTGDLPSGVTVLYTDNEGTEPGVYRAKAVLSGDGYKTLELFADLTINETPHAKVGTAEELEAALQRGGLIVLTDDIAVDGDRLLNAEYGIYGGLAVTEAVDLNGAGHRIVASGYEKANYRILNVSASNCTVRLRNFSAVADVRVSYLRGINIDGTENLTLEMKNVGVTLADYYALNITQNNTELRIDAEELSLSAWAAVYNHASGVIFNAARCNFNGYNPHANAEGASDNSFTTFIMAEYVLLNDDAFVAENLSANNRFTLTNCTLTSRVAVVDGKPINTVQSLVDIRSPYNNTLIFDRCVITACDDVHDTILSAYDSAYIPDDRRNDPDYTVNTNKVFLNGTDVTDDPEFVTKYYDE